MKSCIKLIISLLFLFFCHCRNCIPENAHNKKNKPDERIFYRVSTRNMSQYFNNPADSSKLGKIVDTHLLDQEKFASDTVESFFLRLGLCIDKEAQLYTPCNPKSHTVLKINDKYRTYDTIVAADNHPQDLEENKNAFGYTIVYLKTSDTEPYYYSETILGELVGYYIDNIGYKNIVIFDKSLSCISSDTLNSGLILFEWKNAQYVADSLFTINGELLKTEKYFFYYKKYIIDCRHLIP